MSQNAKDIALTVHMSKKRHVPYLKKKILPPNLLLLAVEQEIWLHETAMDRLILITTLK